MVCPDAGKTLFLAILFGIGSRNAGNCTLHAYANDYTPDDDSITSSFTEASFGGYSSISITPSNWGSPLIVSHVAESDWTGPPTWSCTSGSPQDIYGWYLTDDLTGTTMLAQRFDAPRNMIPGWSESIDPFRFQLGNLC